MHWPRPLFSGSRAANIAWGFGVRNARAVRCQPIKSRKSQKADEVGGGVGGGWGDSDTFCFRPQNFCLDFCRHIGVPFVHHKPLTSNNNNNNKKLRKKMWWDISISVVRAWECGEMRETHAQCVRVGSSVVHLWGGGGNFVCANFSNYWWFQTKPFIRLFEL